MQVHLAVDEEQPLLGRKAEGRTFTTGRVAGAIAAVCGVVGLAALKRTSAGAPLLGAAKSADPFNDVLQRQSSQFEELAASRQEGIKMMAELQVYAFVHPEGMSNLGASEYQTCVAPNSAPKNGYKKTDVGTIREDLVFATDLFTTERNNAQPVTDFANSAAAVTSISCKAPPAIKFSDTKVCEEDRGFCDNNCYMPVPENCAEGKKNFGSCSPTVGSVCASITDVSDGCNTISEEINAERAKYTAMDPGASPCADTPGTPYKIASEKQGEYQTALNMWAGAVNDATEVCTVGHGLLVHNEGMYDRHYEVMKEITADLKELCDQSDGANKFDFGAAVADAQKNSIPTVRRRKLVWWQQLCEPTLTSLEQIMDSLEIASPQLQCFAEKCTEKKATEANAFKALKAAHNGYVSALNTYKTKADAFNGYVDTKEEQKAGVIAKLESFHAGKQANSKIYARDKASFDRFDSGADAGHCGLTSCQVKTVCHAHIKDYFASFINPDTCQAVPMTVDQVCKGTTRVEDSDAAKAAAEKARIASNVKCSMTVDNAIRTVKYGNQDLTADSGSVDSWTSVKVFSFTDAGPTAKLEIYGEEYSNCDGCKCAGLGVHCVSDDSTSPWHNFVSDTTHWKSRVENSNGGDTEYATPCVSSSGFSLRGFSHDSRCDAEGSDGKYCKIWAAGAWANGAWANKYVRFSGSPYGPDTEQDTLFTIPTDDASQAECYGARYWDLRAAFGSDDTALGNHFTKYTGSGRENRDASCALSDAEARCYIDRYEDAKAFAGADLEKAREHYYETGISEHRDFVCPPGVKELKCYVQRYADLKQAFGTNYDTPGTSSALYKAGMHWFKNGKAENRDYSC